MFAEGGEVSRSKGFHLERRRQFMPPVSGWFWIALASMLGAVQAQALQRDSSLQLRFVTEFVLGLDDENPDAMFGQVRALQTDNEARIFIADAISASVKVFGSKGKSLGHIGGRGFGQGRLRSVGAIQVKADGSLLAVFDIAARLSVFYDGQGQFVSAKSIDERLAKAGDGLLQTPSGDYLVLQKLPGIDPLFHLFDSASGLLLRSFGPIAREQSGESIALKQFVEIHPGDFWLIDDSSRLLFAPGLFRGEAFSYRLTGGALEATVRMRSRLASHSFCQAEENSAPADNAHFITSIDGTTYSANIGCESRGIFAFEDGRIILFSLVRGLGDIRHLMVEVFGPDGEILASGPLQSNGFPQGGPQVSSLAVMWKDASNRFYVVERTARPLVYVGQLELSPARHGNSNP